MNDRKRRLFNRVCMMFMTVTALGGSLAGAAQASSVLVLPDAVYYNSVFVTEPNGVEHLQSSNLPTRGLSLIGGGNYDPPQSWQLSTRNEYGFPQLEAHVVADDGVEGVASSELRYSVAFAGADGTIPVTIRANGSAGLAAFTPGQAGLRRQNLVDATLIIQNPIGDEVVSMNAESEISTSQDLHLFSLDQQFMLQANTVYEVIMYATVYAAYGHLGNAFVDPTFTPPPGYTVLTSAGIGNGAVATTPIPAALPLFTSALGGLGVLGWRRKKAQRAA